MSAPPGPQLPRALPAIGCAGMMLALLFTCLLPLMLFDVMQTALQRLHLTPPAAALVVVGMFLGSLVNIPVHRFTREQPQPEVGFGPLGMLRLRPRFRQLRMETVIAMNLGGCVIPCLLAAWQVFYLLQMDAAVLLRLLIVAAANVIICYQVARPVQGVGIMMPGLVSPAVAVGLTWVLVEPGAPERVPIAFVAGVLGPVIGADLLHLKDILKVPVGVLSIGGAGTFDGIVLSGILAALLA